MEQCLAQGYSDTDTETEKEGEQEKAARPFTPDSLICSGPSWLPYSALLAGMRATLSQISQELTLLQTERKQGLWEGLPCDYAGRKRCCCFDGRGLVALGSEEQRGAGDITQKGYEKKRAKLLAPYIPQIQGVDPSLQIENRIQGSSQPAPAVSKQQKSRASNSRDERFRSDVHTEAVQAALAKYKERKMPMPSKRRSVLVQSSMEACTPPDTSSASEDEGSLRRPGPPSVERWFNRVIQGSSTSSSSSSTSSHPGGWPLGPASSTATTATVLADLMAQSQIENHSAPPDVTTGLSQRSVHVERPQVASVRGVPRGLHNTTILETADGVPVNSRVSSKIQQLLNTLKRPKRPPLREFFLDDFEELLDGVPVNSRVSSKIQQLLNTLKRPKRPPLREFFLDDFEELLDVQQPDPNQPKPEGPAMSPLTGEPLGVVTNWPPSLLAAMQRWGTTQPKTPCLTALDNSGKPVYTLTYGVPVNSRVSSKIQQLLNTLKRPKRPPLREFFLDDFEELLDVQQPDPNQPKPEGPAMSPLTGEPLGVVTNWPPSLLAAMQHWGTTQPKTPCLTALDNSGKPVYTLTYGEQTTAELSL
ncbi:UNVERIFIED_CONTAM: hypothetical protein FKN15_031629 [Acipenser sinensis]